MSIQVPQALKTAKKLYRQGNFAGCIAALETQILHFRESPQFYRLLGMACLRSGDLGGGETYLSRSLQLDPSDVDARLGSAFLKLKRGETPKALQLWLEVLEEVPGHPTAQWALNQVRRGKNPEEMSFWLAQEKTVRRLLPADMPLQFPWKPLLAGLAVLSLGALLLLLPWRNWLPTFESSTPIKNPEPSPDLPARPGAELADLSGLDQFTTLTGSFSQILTLDEIKETFKKMKAYFSKFQDNLAQREINRILISNASYSVKERARTLGTFIKSPDFVSFKENFSYSEVQKNPLLHKDCFIKWKGAIANIRDKETLRMDLLVGYETGKVLEGVAPLKVDFAFRPQEAQAVEVLGQIKIDGSKWFVEALGIHPFGLRNE